MAMTSDTHTYGCKRIVHRYVYYMEMGHHFQGMLANIFTGRIQKETQALD